MSNPPGRRFRFDLAASLAALMATAACSGSPAGHRLVVPAPASTTSPASPASSTTPTAPTAPTATTTASGATPAPTTAKPSTTTPPVATGVGTVTLAVVDTTRPTVQYGHTLANSRRLPTLVRYPAVGPAGGVVGPAGGVVAADVPGAPPAPGRYPLVIFAHGYNVTPATYAHLLHAWAGAGFVVAAPAFPLETAGGPLDENDLGNEPRDISVVINAVLAQTTGPLAGHVDASRIAVTGHSDGAEAALAAGYLAPPIGDRRIGPVISMAAQGILGGPRPDPHHPLLVVQGTQDTINPPARGDAVYAAAGPPRFELHLLGGGHLPPVADDTPWRPIVERVTTTFLHDFLDGPSGPAAIATLVSQGNQPGLSNLSADP